MTNATTPYECLGCEDVLSPDDWVVSMIRRGMDVSRADHRPTYAHSECYAAAYGREYRYRDEGVLANLERSREAA